MEPEIQLGLLPNFEDFKHQNGVSFWWAREFMMMLGYDDFDLFKTKVIGRATQALISLGVDHYSQIIPEKRNINGEDVEDFKLTRFACYIVAMNGNPQKKEVAAAQAYFAQETRKLELYLEGHDDMARLIYREEYTAGHKSLMDTAAKSGVENFGNFNNAGYIGLYNKTAEQLKRVRNLPQTTTTRLQDYMGRTELAANLFRVTQTEERLRQDDVSTQSQAEKTHFNIGRRIRQMVEENAGKLPEQLPVQKKLPEVRKELKKAKKALEKVDGKK
ncbi:damage-inducible protein [Candidatus Uhrbacteria bacterium]|nr:damage-inducible protein [Candidatus Uhrbacteria bacterium]